MSIDLTVEAILVAAGLGLAFAASKNKGTGTGINLFNKPKKKTCHGGAHINPPKITRVHFPTPTSGKMWQQELQYARDHGIYLNPDGLCSSVKKKLGFDGHKTSDGTVIVPYDTTYKPAPVNDGPASMFPGLVI